MEYEIRFYYPIEEYNNKLKDLKKINSLKYLGRKYEITSQFNHPSKEYDFYTKKIDGRFRIRKTEDKNSSKCMLSWKRRLNDTSSGKVNKEEEVELTIKPEEYDNLMFIVKEVLHMSEVEAYERYRTVFSNKEVEIVLDEYPFGLALEIEAKAKTNQENIVDKYVKLLNLNYEDSYRLSWDDKYEELCREQNKEKYNIVLFNKDMPKVKTEVEKNLDAIKYVVDNSEYVKINNKKIKEFTKEINVSDWTHWYHQTNLKLNEKEWILLSFILESINFCFWQKPKIETDYNGTTYTGSNGLFFAVVKAVEEKRFILKEDKLKDITEKEFKEIFKPYRGEIPHIEKRYKNFKEVIDIFNEKDVYKELFNIKSDTELLKYIISNFKSFDDKSTYNDITVHFNKRANLLVSDLYSMSSTIKKNIKSIDNILGCADYGIPRLFREYGILEYTKELDDMIENEEEIPHNSKMEIEIRSNMLYSIELLKEELKKSNVIINSIKLDNLIWAMYKSKAKTRKKTHHTVTIYY